MRPIKFRVWNKKEKKMYGSKGQYTCGLVILLGGFTKYSGCLDYSSEPCFDDFQWYTKKIVEERYVLMQFAGLTDKNGKGLDWWEGDILKKDNGCLAEIVFHNGCFMGKWIGRDDLPLFYFNQDTQLPKWFEVIGNIHENPELLEVKE